MLAYILFDPNLHAALRTETAAAYRDNGTLDIPTLMTSCPLLESAYFEILRIVNTARSSSPSASCTRTRASSASNPSNSSPSASLMTRS